MSANQPSENAQPSGVGSKDLLGGLTLGTVLSLKYSEDDHFHITHSGPEDFGYYAGYITTLEGRPIVSTKHIFESADAAENHMRFVVKAAREFKTMNPPNAEAQRRGKETTDGK